MDDPSKLNWRDRWIVRPGLQLMWWSDHRRGHGRMKTRRQMLFEGWLWRISGNRDLADLFREARIEEYGR